MREERIELSERERDRLKVLHEVEEGHLRQVAAAQRLVKTGGRLVKHARHYWLLAEGHLTRRLFGDVLGRIAALRRPDGLRTGAEEQTRARKPSSGEASAARQTGGQSRHSGSAERPKRAARPHQTGQRDLQLTRRGGRTRLLREGETQNGNSSLKEFS
jgi:hypothetical protein